MKKGFLLLALSVATLIGFGQSIVQTNEVSIALAEAGTAGSPRSTAQFSVILNSTTGFSTSQSGNELWLYIRVPRSVVPTIDSVTIPDQGQSFTVGSTSGFFSSGSSGMSYQGAISSDDFHYLLFMSATGINLNYLGTNQWKWAFIFRVNTPAPLTTTQLAQFSILEENNNSDLLNYFGVTGPYYSRLMYGPDDNAKNLLSAALNILPSTFLEFNVSKQGSTGALVSWTTVNESNVNAYSVQRSFTANGGWSTVGLVAPKGTDAGATTYSYADANINFGSASSKVVYYRVITKDNDAREKISPIRSLQFNANNGKGVTVYPNPAKEGFYVTVPLLNPQDKKVRLSLVSQAGQVVSVRDIAASAANNYFFDINTSGIVAGDYTLQVVMDGQVLDTKKIMVQR